MVELGDHDMGERSERRLAARDRLYGRCCLHDLLSGAAAILGPDGADDPPLDRHGVEHLVAVLTHRAQGAATIGARAVAMLGLDPLFFTRQMVRERANRCGTIEGGRIDAPRAHRGGFGLELFECQLELGDLVGKLLGRLAELHALEAGKLHAQRIDQDIAGGDIGVRGRQCVFQLGDPSVLIRGGKACVRHREYIANRTSKSEKKRSNPGIFSLPETA